MLKARTVAGRGEECARYVTQDLSHGAVGQQTDGMEYKKKLNMHNNLYHAPAVDNYYRYVRMYVLSTRTSIFTSNSYLFFVRGLYILYSYNSLHIITNLQEIRDHS